MTAFPDLTPLTYYGAEAAQVLIAVGWLGRDMEYQKGPLPEPELLRKLMRHVQQPYGGPLLLMGVHTCELCGAGEPTNRLRRLKVKTAKYNSGEFCLPYAGKLICAPLMLVHYLDAHEYAPPQEFWQALADAPEPGADFDRSIRENGGLELERMFSQF